MFGERADPVKGVTKTGSALKHKGRKNFNESSVPKQFYVRNRKSGNAHMSNQPFLQLYVGDYLADTTDLTTEEHGAYLLLLLTMWRHGATLPNEPVKLARICRLSPAKFNRVWGEISRFFTVEETRISQKRLSKEYQKASEKSKIRSTAGAKGGRAKALKINNQGLAKATDLPPDLLKHSSEPEPDIDTNVSIPPIIPRPISDAAQAVEEYNKAAESAGWSKVQKITKPRLSAIKARLAECGGLDGWRVVLDKAAESPFLCGDNDRGWRADFDFMTKAQKFTQIIEGKYDRTDRSTARGPNANAATNAVNDAASILVARRYGRKDRQG